MKSFRGFITLLVNLTFLFSCFHLKAAMQKEYVPMEGQFDQIGPKSIDPIQALQVFLDENSVNIEFYQYIPEVTISIKDSNNNVVYTKKCSLPEVEIISLVGFGKDSYTLELTTERGDRLYGTFLYGD